MNEQINKIEEGTFFNHEEGEMETICLEHSCPHKSELKDTKKKNKKLLEILENIDSFNADKIIKSINEWKEKVEEQNRFEAIESNFQKLNEKVLKLETELNEMREKNKKIKNSLIANKPLMEVWDNEYDDWWDEV